MTIPDYQTLMLPVLRLGAEGEKRVIDVVDQIADQFHLDQEERAQLLPSGRQRVLHNRIHWAKFYLTKAGLISAPSRGKFVATGEGRKLLESRPLKIDAALLEGLSPAFREFVHREAGSRQSSAGELGQQITQADTAITATTATPEEQIEAAYQALHSALRSELIQRIVQNPPSFFEQLIIELLVAMGYGGTHANAAQQLGRSGDGGVDGIINEDRLGLDRVYVQAKRYAVENSVSRPAVQGFLGSLVGLGASKGVFVTTSTFTSQANEFVRHLPQRIVLIDGETLANLMIEHGVGVRTSRTIEFKRVDEDFFSEEE